MSIGVSPSCLNTILVSVVGHEVLLVKLICIS